MRDQNNVTASTGTIPLFLMLAALAVGIASAFFAAPFNGLSMLALVLLVLSISIRCVEVNRDRKAALQKERTHDQ